MSATFITSNNTQQLPVAIFHFISHAPDGMVSCLNAETRYHQRIAKRPGLSLYGMEAAQSRLPQLMMKLENLGTKIIAVERPRSPILASSAILFLHPNHHNEVYPH